MSDKESRSPLRMMPLPHGWHWFLCEYRMDDGSVWAFEITAQSHEDAETRIRCIGQRGKVNGRIDCEGIRMLVSVQAFSDAFGTAPGAFHQRVEAALRAVGLEVEP